MQKQIQLRLTPAVAYQRVLLRDEIARQVKRAPKDITAFRIRKRSIDARQRNIFVQLTIDVYVDEPAPEMDFSPIDYPSVENARQVIVVGAGPAGLFAALRLIELGLRPIVLERGKDVRSRKIDLARISREHVVEEESNYSFGEGGAGAYSDGKLFTRSKKRGSIEKILRIFCQFGASPNILIDAHPHIGTDCLPRIIEAMRTQIIESGGEAHFQTRADAFVFQQDKVVGVETQTGETFLGPVILATGHSARDVYRYLFRSRIPMEAKGLAIGVRLEHPAHVIDCVQYHSREGRGKYLPAAEYSFVHQIEERGVYSFCMCPGGTIVPAASGKEQIVVNGMSPSHRNGHWSNSGVVVEVRPEHLLQDEEHLYVADHLRDVSPEEQSVLGLMYFQECLERNTWLQGNRRQTAPAQRMTDFVNGKLSFDLPKSSYAPGIISSPLHFWMPRPIVSRLQEMFRTVGRRQHGFLTHEAVVIAAETRTSAPVRILRDGETLQHVSTPGLFPCGEGAGYAGGIVSAAVDGERCAEAVARYLG